MKKGNRRVEASQRRGEWELRLYIAGETPKAVAAFGILQRICEEYLKGRYRIEVIDLMKNPKLARGIRSPRSRRSCASCRPPVKKIIGDLANEEKVLVGLDLRPVEE